ncbi:ATP-binding cassette domain-containing protein [Leucobacter sp. gxy201]|uniref:sugar ABC transporter ATP-binding protein n=1 Tax=Leucobacter sp. gxy201 TaxID=2957200 RepID=UPI003DA14D59
MTTEALLDENGREIAFSIEDVSMVFPGVRALSGVSLFGYPGEVLAICGANGAGKSTLAGVLAGQTVPTEGRVRIAGYAGEITSPSDAEDAGILLMHQEPLVIDTFTVQENVWLKQLSGSGGSRGWKRVKTDAVGARKALDAVGLTDVPLKQSASSLPPGLRQMLALSRTQVVPHRILLLDETTASTTEEHFQDVLQLVAAERAAGTSIIFVSHRMQEVFSMADRIAVLRNGRLVGIRETASTDHDEILTMMVGERVAAIEPPENAPGPEIEPLVRVEGLAAGSAHDISFTIRPGEILGMYGLVGSGRSSIARAISGQQERYAGTVTIGGRETHARTPFHALDDGVVYVSEDRRKEGFLPDFSNGQNMTISTLGRYSKGGVLKLREERAEVDRLITEYQVKGTGSTLTRTLSGGNQQKVCLAKWLEAEPEFVILDEPTKGIDIAARMNIYQIIRRLADAGKAVLVVSSEAEEATALCHRILIARDGEIVAEMHPHTDTADDVIRASLGGKAA